MIALRLEPLSDIMDCGEQPKELLYTPLNPAGREIRLLRMESSTSEDIILSLRAVSEFESIEYFALSYVWGDPTDRETIRVDGRLISVTRSLASALHEIHRQFLRRESSIKVFNKIRSSDALQRARSVFWNRGAIEKRKSIDIWADALCINQEDNDEKAQQVPMMGEIYSKANMVLAWQGSGDFRKAFSVIPKAAEALRHPRRGVHSDKPGHSTRSWLTYIHELGEQEYDLRAQLEPSQLGKMGKEHASLTANRHWDNICLLVSNTYWRRIWIVQEVCLSQQTILLSAGGSVKLEDLWELVSWVRTTTERPDSMNPSLWERLPRIKQACQYIGYFLEMQKETRQLADQQRSAEFDQIHPLLLLEGFEATNPRDRIYGLYSLNHLNLGVNYNTPVAEVFTLAAKEVATMYHPECLMRRAGIGAYHYHHDPDLPSWVPDWRNFRAATFNDRGACGAGRPPNLRSRKVPEIAWHVQMNTLQIRGAFFQRVSTVTLFSTSEELRSWCLAQMARHGWPESDFGSAFYRMLVNAMVNTTCHPEGTSEDWLFVRGASFACFLALGQEWRSKIRTSEGHTELRTRLRQLGFRDDPDSFKRNLKPTSGWGYSNVLRNGRLLGDGKATESLRRGSIYDDDSSGFLDATVWLLNMTGAGTDLGILDDFLSDDIIRTFSIVRFDNEWFGLGPRGAQPEDMLYIIQDAFFPCLLRKVNGKDMLVGVCRLQYLADGQIFPMIDNGKFSFENISIV